MLMRRIAIVNPPYILSGLMKLAALFVKKKIMSRVCDFSFFYFVSLCSFIFVISLIL